MKNAAIASALAILGLTTAVADALPASISTARATQPADATPIVKVHGTHRSCTLGGGGWHYHTVRGIRVACARGPVIIIR